MSTAHAYLITFTCYGSHLHGAEPATVHRNHNCFGGRWLEPHPGRLLAAEKRMKQLHYLLDPPSRQVVLASIQEICALRHWDLLAAHVRANHVHVVVEASVKPEIVMHALKTYASQILNRQQPGVKRWTRHGSTRYLWDDQQVGNAINYVVNEQGEPMAVFSSTADRSMLSRL